MSNWFNNLSQVDKEVVLNVVTESVEMSVFGFLCVLDGASAIEDNETKRRLELLYIKNGIRHLLNDPEQDYLHDLL